MKRFFFVGLALVFSVLILCAISSRSEAASLKSSIIGKWVRTYGNGDKQIEFLKDGTFITAEVAGDYRFIDDNRLRMDARGAAMVFEVSIDKDGVLILKRQDGDASRYITEKVHNAQEGAKYIGTWVEKDSDKKYTVIFQNNKYRIKVWDGKKELYEIFGTYKDGKIIAKGKASDYYKFEIPTFKILENGELLYDHGAGPDKLKKLK